jgi:hypothetical protein
VHGGGRDPDAGSLPGARSCAIPCLCGLSEVLSLSILLRSPAVNYCPVRRFVRLAAAKTPLPLPAYRGTPPRARPCRRPPCEVPDLRHRHPAV